MCVCARVQDSGVCVRMGDVDDYGESVDEKDSLTENP